MYFVIFLRQSDASPTISHFDEFGRAIDERSTESCNEIFGYEVRVHSGDDEISLGAFARLTVRADAVEISGDYLGQEPVFYFSCEQLILASNSFWLLIEVLRVEGIPINCNHQVALLHSIDSQMTMQLTSEQTIVDGVFNLPAHATLRIDRNTRHKPELIRNQLSLEGFSYEKLVCLGAQYSALLLKSAVVSYQFPVLSLSGGRDSRGVLAAARALLGEEFSKRIQVRSGTQAYQKEELEIACRVGDALGFPVNGELRQQRRCQRLQASDAIHRWLTGNAGTYTAWGPSPTYYPDDTLVSLRGGQGATTGKSGSIMDFSKTVHDATGLPREWLINHFADAANCDPERDLDEIFDRHYLSWRYRIHYGRPSAEASRWALNVDPLINPFLDEANLRLSQEDRYRGRLALDLIIAFDPACLCVGFSTNSSGIDQTYIESGFLWPLGLGPLSRSQLLSTYEENIRPVGGAANGDWNSDFEAEVISEMIGFLRDSSSFRQMVLLDMGQRYARELEESNFPSDRIRAERNRFARLYLFCRTFG